MTQSKPQRPSRRHHFIPQFVLAEWADEKGEVACYWPRGDNVVRGKRLSTKSFAYEDWLYETSGLPPEHAQQMEDKYFKLLDTRAAIAHRLLCDGRNDELSHEMICDWARLIMSIWLRTPGDVRGLKTVIDALHDPTVSERVVGLTVPDDFPDGGLNQLRMEALRAAIDDEDRGVAFLSMTWGVITVPGPGRLLISDWPQDSAKGLPFLGHPKSYLTFPISPKKLFVAAVAPDFLRAIGELPVGELERRQNYAAVSQARRFVGAVDDAEDGFIKANFGCEGRPSIARSIADAWSVPL